MKLSKFHLPTVEYFKHQRDGIIHLAKQKKSLLLLPTGLGKTFTAFSMYAYLKENHERKAIFVTTKTVVGQVPNDIRKFFGNNISSVHLYEDTKNIRKAKYQMFRESKDVLVITYDNIRYDYEDIIVLVKELNAYLILDEATAFKNDESKIHKMINNMCRYTDRVTALTATAITGKLEDVVHISNAVGIKEISRPLFNKRFVVWGRQQFGRKSIPYVRGYKNLDEFYNKMKPYMFIRSKKEVTDIPPFTIKKYFIPKDKNMIEAEDALYEKYTTADPNDPSKKTVNAPIGLLSIAYTNPDLILHDQSRSSKFDFIKQLIEEQIDNDEKTILFCEFKSIIKSLEIYLQNAFGKNTTASIHGDTKDRQGQKNKFIEVDECKYFLGTGAMSHGTDGLHKVANNIIFVIPPNTSDTLQQVAGRISRLGTEYKHLTLYFIFVSNSIDFELYKLIQSQLILVDKINPNSVDDGIIDDEITQPVIERLDQSDEWIRNKMRTRFK